MCFLLRFPSSHPGSPLATSLPCGARTFLPRTQWPAGDPPVTSSASSVHDPAARVRWARLAGERPGRLCCAAMRAILIDEPGDESCMRLGEAPAPTLVPGCLRVRVVAAG